MNYENATKDSYILELDKNGAPKFTQNNLKLINTFLKYDSNYSSVENTENPSYNSTYSGKLEKYGEAFFNFKSIADYKSEDDYVNHDPLYLVIESIDKINSTHLASEGPKGGNRGRLITATEICKIKNFKQRLWNGDAKLVNEIAEAVKGKNNFSFASKFCAYLCRYLFKGTPQEDNFCIYDAVVQSVLPYYAYKYNTNCKAQYTTTRTGRKVSTVYKFKDSRDYESYISYVREVVFKIREECKIKITFKEFDHMLWYFFKGQPHKIEELMEKII